MSIEITVEDGKVSVTTPYSPEFPAKARSLGGKWNGKVWQFDARDEERVRKAVKAVYGTTGEADETTVTLRVDVNAHVGDWDHTLWLCGRKVAHRFARDSAVRLGKDCVVVEGGFEKHGGSVKNPRLCPKPGTVVEIRDVPVSIAQEVEHAEIVSEGGEKEDSEVVTLKAREAELLAELASVRAELTKLGVGV